MVLLVQAVKKLGKFEIIQKVGQGAMGVVYKADDPMIELLLGHCLGKMPVLRPLSVIAPPQILAQARNLPQQ